MGITGTGVSSTMRSDARAEPVHVDPAQMGGGRVFGVCASNPVAQPACNVPRGAASRALRSARVRGLLPRLSRASRPPPPPGPTLSIRGACVHPPQLRDAKLACNVLDLHLPVRRGLLDLHHQFGGRLQYGTPLPRPLRYVAPRGTPRARLADVERTGGLHTDPPWLGRRRAAASPSRLCPELEPVRRYRLTDPLVHGDDLRARAEPTASSGSRCRAPGRASSRSEFRARRSRRAIAAHQSRRRSRTSPPSTSSDPTSVTQVLTSHPGATSSPGSNHSP